MTNCDQAELKSARVAQVEIVPTDVVKLDLREGDEHSPRQNQKIADVEMTASTLRPICVGISAAPRTLDALG